MPAGSQIAQGATAAALLALAANPPAIGSESELGDCGPSAPRRRHCACACMTRGEGSARSGCAGRGCRKNVAAIRSSAGSSMRVQTCVKKCARARDVGLVDRPVPARVRESARASVREGGGRCCVQTDPMRQRTQRAVGEPLQQVAHENCSPTHPPTPHTHTRTHAHTHTHTHTRTHARTHANRLLCRRSSERRRVVHFRMRREVTLCASRVERCTMRAARGMGARQRLRDGTHSTRSRSPSVASRASPLRPPTPAARAALPAARTCLPRAGRRAVQKPASHRTDLCCSALMRAATR